MSQILFLIVVCTEEKTLIGWHNRTVLFTDECKMLYLFVCCSTVVWTLLKFIISSFSVF